MRRFAIVSMGKASGSLQDSLNKNINSAVVTVKGILDDVDLAEDLKGLTPHDDEPFIVTNLNDVEEIRISEKRAIELVNRCLLSLEEKDYDASLILCTGHFNPPEMKMPVIIPEKTIPALLKSMRIKKIGIIVPKPEQIDSSENQYESFCPIVRAASPYGTYRELRQTAQLFLSDDVEMILMDCMGFTKEHADVVVNESGKKVLVPRELLSNLLINIFV